MKEEIKYYTPETQGEVINWIMSEGYLPIKGEVETEGMSNFKLSFGEDFKDNLYNLVEFINSQNKTEFNNKTVEQSIALELYEIPYLNQQDIEECGFIKAKEYSDETVFQKHIYDYEFTELTLHIDETYNVTIEKWYQSKTVAKKLPVNETNWGGYIIFRGIIKNKSKLKEVLQMVGVL